MMTRNKMMCLASKWDGHTHTELCPHGSADKTATMIEKAIDLGFTDYSLTEHAPLPKTFLSSYAGDREGYETASLTWEQVEAYLALAQDLQRAYKKQIHIHIGFELDYLAGFESDRQDFLKRFASHIEDLIVSVHFLPDEKGQFWCLDYSIEECQKGFASYLAMPNRLIAAYYQAVYEAVQMKGSFPKSCRLGHLDLIKKYQDYWQWPRLGAMNPLESKEAHSLIGKILDKAKERQWGLDLNMAGLYKPYCNDSYPSAYILQEARKRGVPLVYGSDAHSLGNVGHAYYMYERI